jgi:hypothetical protein
MNLLRDSKDHEYIEIQTLADEHLRLTFIPAAEAGYKADSIRINIRASSGQVRQPGPEIPVQSLESILHALRELTHTS